MKVAFGESTNAFPFRLAAPDNSFTSLCLIALTLTEPPVRRSCDRPTLRYRSEDFPLDSMKVAEMPAVPFPSPATEALTLRG